MPADDLREAVAGLMGRAKDDLAELVAFRSVADPKQYPPEECEKAAQWVVDAFAEVGLQDVAMSPTPDGSMAVHGHAPGPEGAPTVLLYSPLRRAAAARRGRLDVAGLGADRARRPLVRPRRGRLQGQHRHAPHRAARAQAGRRRLPVRHQDHLRGLRGAGHRRPRGVRAGERRAAARRHDPGRRHRQLRRRRADADDHAARHDERRRHAARARQRDALGHVRRAGAGPGRRR